MTVAVKNTPEVSTSSLLDRLAVTSLAGVVYVLGSIAVVAQGVPTLWWTYLGLSRQSFPAWALLFVAMIAATVGLVYVGGRLLGPSPPRGARAGIVVGLVGVLLIGLVVKWIGGLVENWSFERNWFSQQVAIGVTVVLAVILLGLFGRFFFKPSFENFLRAFEGQGWFQAASYKASQGLKVRRGTMLGMLILVGSGVWAYERSLQSGADSWAIDLPFTGKFTVKTTGDVDGAPGLNVDWGQERRILDPGDWPEFKADQVTTQAAVDDALAKLKDGLKIREGDADRFSDEDFIDRPALIVAKEAFDRVQRNATDKIASFVPRLPTAAPVLNRYYVQQKNAELRPDAELERGYVRITKATSKDPFKVGDVKPAKEFKDLEAQRLSQINKLEDEAEKLKAAGQAAKALPLQQQARDLKLDMPQQTEPTPMDGVVQFQTLTLVPSVRFVMPLLLGAVALWSAWRLVNLPSFADFLIATEAELNKVSWTPRRRLVQDTIVVLVTTLLITFFLLFADLIWSQLLTRVGVLRTPKDTSGEVQSGGEDLPW